MNKIKENAKNRIGEIHTNSQGHKFEIIDYLGTNNCTIRFDDEFNTIVYNICYGSIKKGSARNRNNRILFNKGYIGYGNYNEIRGRKYYSTWRSIFLRCYDKKSLEKFPSYKDCEISSKWHNLQNYAKWFDENYVKDWQLDKDILIKGNKIYSPETCCFVPSEINKLLVVRKRGRGEHPMGVRKRGNRFEARIAFDKKEVLLGYFDTPEEAFQAFKIAKEARIKQMADEWKPLIKPNVYQAMYNYKVEITD